LPPANDELVPSYLQAFSRFINSIDFKKLIRQAHELSIILRATYTHTHTHPGTYTHICKHTHIHINIHTFTHTPIHAHANAHTHTLACTHIHTLANTYTHINAIHTHTPTCTHIHTHKPTCTHLHTHTHINTYAHTYTNKHTHAIKHHTHTYTHTSTFIVFHHPGARYKIKPEDRGKFENKLILNLLSRFNCINKYCDILKYDEKLGEKVKQSTDTDELISKFTSILTANCDAAFNVSRDGDRVTKGRSAPWWASELTILRKRALALRRRYRRTRNCDNVRQQGKLHYQEGKRHSQQNSEKKN